MDKEFAADKAEWLVDDFLEHESGESGDCDEEVAVEAAVVAGVGDPGEYAAMLKRKLDLYCAAVAKSMDDSSMTQESSSLANPNSQTSDASQLASQTSTNGSVTTGNITNHFEHSNCVMKKPANSCSSKDLSNDDDGDSEEETLTMENMAPAAAKRMRRMLSNRESARRSRTRKQDHLNDIEMQLSQLRVENASLMKRLTDMNNKYNEATVENRVLKADVETMRAKVKMAEDTVKRVPGVTSLFPAIEDEASLFLQASLIDDVARDAAAGGKMCRTASMQRVASLEHLQKRICAGSSSVLWDAAPWDPVRGCEAVNDNIK